MRRHHALTGANDDDLPILDSYFQFLEGALDTRKPIDEFRRVIALTGAPDVARGAAIDATKLISVARSAECLEFRQWLRTASTETDDEVVRRFRSLMARLGVQVTGNVGKGLRWVASSLTMLLPDGGAISGPAVGALDSFFVDKLVQPGGPAVFLNRLYPSIFE